MILLIILALVVQLPTWNTQTSGVRSRLRGVSAVNERVAWASGADSTVLRTSDGGATWRKLFVTVDQLDFRDLDAIDEQTAYVLAIGNGTASRIYKTSDAGRTWALQFKNDDPKAFLDAMSFWDADHGIAFGDSISGKFHVLITENGGREWKRVPESALPAALENEGAFAASGTNIAVYGKTHAWIATGAAIKSRVLRTSDRGRTWQISDSPIDAGPSAGNFSIAFRDARHGAIVGGDYKKENEAGNNLAVTVDGGATWNLVKGLTGFRSVVAYVPVSSGKKPATAKPQVRSIIAIGPAGADYSSDDGQTWQRIPGPGFDTFSFAPASSNRPTIGWAAGANGTIARFTLTL